jgi:hypothetical protein
MQFTHYYLIAAGGGIFLQFVRGRFPCMRVGGRRERGRTGGRTHWIRLIQSSSEALLEEGTSSTGQKKQENGANKNLSKGRAMHAFFRTTCKQNNVSTAAAEGAGPAAAH